MHSDSTPNVRRRIAGPLALVAALALALAPSRALAAPSKPNLTHDFSFIKTLDNASPVLMTT